MALFHLTDCPTQSHPENFPLGSQGPVQISSPPDDFHIDSGGLKIPKLTRMQIETMMHDILLGL